MLKEIAFFFFFSVLVRSKILLVMLIITWIYLLCFQVAAVASIVAALYMRIFLKDTTRHIDDAALNLEQPILKPDLETTLPGSRSPDQTDAVGKIPLPKDIIRLLKSRYECDDSMTFTYFFPH